MPNASRGTPVSGSIPITPSRSPNSRLAKPCSRDSPSTADTATNARTASAKYSAGPKRSASSTIAGAQTVSAAVAERAGDERSDRGGGQRRASASGARHQVALHRGHDRRALARRVQQDRRRRAAVHAAVVDAGEHDERCRRIERVGDRQQQRDRQRGADAGQHADRRAQRDAGERPEQVLRRQRDREAAGERDERVHQMSANAPSREPDARVRT